MVVVVLLLLLLLNLVDASRERLDEELYVRNVGNGVGAHFQFTTRWEQDGDAWVWDSYNLFPKQLGQILDTFKVQEMSISLSKGEWDYDNWGVEFTPAPSGTEMWAVFEDRNVSSVYGSDHVWKRLVRSVSGISCASLESLDEMMVGQPLEMFKDLLGKGLGVRYGQLNSEASCTENLTPWLQLLPYRSHAGLAKLIVPWVVYRSQFHALSVHFRKFCSDKKCAVELVLSLTVVSMSDAGVFETLSGKKGFELVPASVAMSSKVLVENGDKGGKKDYGDCGGRVSLFDLKKMGSMSDADIGELKSQPVAGLVKAKRFATGAGTLHGGFVTRIDVSKGLDLMYFELVPSYLRIDPRSLRVSVNGVEASFWNISRIELSRRNAPPSVLEIPIKVPPGGGRVLVTYEFRQAFLPISAFPADPNHGFDAPSPVISYRVPGTSKCVFQSPLLGRRVNGPFKGRLVRLYPGSLIVSMPLPDFSMPYNVITLTSTIMAMFFGSLIGVLITPMTVLPERLTDAEKRKQKRNGMLRNFMFLIILGLAWMYENDRDTLNEFFSTIKNIFST